MDLLVVRCQHLLFVYLSTFIHFYYDQCFNSPFVLSCRLLLHTTLLPDIGLTPFIYKQGNRSQFSRPTI